MVARFILNSIHDSSSSSGERPKLELSKPTVARLSHQPSFSPAKAAAAEVGTCTDLDFFREGRQRAHLIRHLFRHLLLFFLLSSISFRMHAPFK